MCAIEKCICILLHFGSNSQVNLLTLYSWHLPIREQAIKVCHLSCIALLFFSDIPTAAFQYYFIWEKVKLSKKEQAETKEQIE